MKIAQIDIWGDRDLSKIYSKASVGSVMAKMCPYALPEFRSGVINGTALAAVSALRSSPARLSAISESKEPTLTRCG